MSMKHYFRRRLDRLESAFVIREDNSFTLEEICRAIWQESKSDFLELSKHSSLSHFIAQFEREDNERGSRGVK